MPNEFNLPLGSEGSGWTVYAVVFEPEWEGSTTTLDAAHMVWNGTAFVTDSWSARNLGGISLTESGSTGTYTGDFPEGIVEAGSYPITSQRRLGISNDAQNDPAVIYDGQAIYFAGIGPFVDMTYTPSSQASPDRPTITYYAGAGIQIRITPDVPTAINLADWEVRVGVVGAFDENGDGIYDSFTQENGTLTGDEDTGILYANPTAAMTAAWSSSSLQIEVHRPLVDDHETVYGVARINLRGTLRP